MIFQNMAEYFLKSFLSFLEEILGNKNVGICHYSLPQERCSVSLEGAHLGSVESRLWSEEEVQKLSKDQWTWIQTLPEALMLWNDSK